MRWGGLILILAGIATGEVLDRVAVVVGNTVITESEVVQEARIEEFLNQAPVDVSAAARKSAAERLVDQQLVRNEMRVGAYQQPSDQEVETVLNNFRQEHFKTEGEYRAALDRYGITEDQLKRHLAWQMAAIRFTDARFGRQPEQEANRVKPGAPMPAQPAEVDQQFDAWLKQARSDTKVQFKSGAFQ